MQSISRIEQETIYLYNEGEKECEVYTHNAKLKRQLSELAKNRGEECKLKTECERSQTYIIPKSWVKIRPKRILSAEQRKELSDRIKKLRG